MQAAALCTSRRKHCCTNEALQGWCAVQGHVLSCKLQLHADAGCRRDPVSEGTCCTNEALQGWSAVQRHVPELRDAAGCECSWLRMQAAAVHKQAKALLHKRSPSGLECGARQVLSLI